MRGQVGGLLERSAELGAITRALDAAQESQGAMLALEGAAGIGKTRLLDAARAAAAERSFQVLSARGGELERDFAYGIVRQLFERAVAGAPEADREELLAGPASHAAAAVGLDTVAGQQAEDQSFAVRHGLYWLVSNLTGAGPLMIAVDDVQWADAASLRFLAYLSRRLDGLPVLVAVTIRTGDTSADPALLEELAQGTRVEPAPLSLAATVELLGARCGTAAEPGFAAAAHAATGGNPFLVGELAAALASDGIAPIDVNARRVADLGPSTVARSLMLRLGRASPETVRFARAVAVLGVSADPRFGAALAGLSEEAAATAFDTLIAVGVLAPERPLRFAHPILREAVHRDLRPGERDALHAAAATLLTEAGAPASEVAAHLLATPARGQASTVAALREAARIAQGQGAADLAARYLARALAEPPGDDERPVVLSDLGRAEWLAGEDPLAAVSHLREALAGTTEPSARVPLVIALARAAFSIGDVATAAAVLEQELAEPGAATREETLLMEAEFGSIRLLHDASPDLVRRIERFADVPGETIPELLVLTNAAVVPYLNGDAETCARRAEKALGAGRAVAATGGDSIAVLQAVWVLIFAERHELAAWTVDACAEYGQRTGSIFSVASVHALRAIIAYRCGEVQRCEAEARGGVELPGLPPFVHPAVHTYLALALVERGELDEAEAVLERSWIGPHLPVLVHMNPAFYARGVLRAAQGRLEEARDDLHEVGARDARVHLANPGVPWRAAAARVHAALGEDDEARRLVDEHLVHAQRWGTPGVVGAALHAQAVINGCDRGALAEAVAVLERSPARLDYAHALTDLGAEHRAAGARAEAQATLKAALEIARVCGATALVRRAHQELIAAGAKPRRLQFSGVESLTAAERRICEMAATGAGNKEIAQALFVTPKTVENHLGRAYAKLGISSRDALGGLLRDGAPEVEGSPLTR